VTGEHAETRTMQPTADWSEHEMRSNCSCGAHWSHPRIRSREAMDSIFNSHVAYANRMATRVD
jgi:hypothetical protein